MIPFVTIGIALVMAMTGLFCEDRLDGVRCLLYGIFLLLLVIARKAIAP